MRRRAPSMPPSRLSRSSKPRRDDDCRPGVMGVTKLPKRTMNLPPIDPPRVPFLSKSHILTKISARTPVEDGQFESSPGALGSTRSRWTSVTYIRIRFCLVVLKF